MTQQPPAAKRERSPAKFYIAAGACLALLAFGVWFWRAWNVWWFDADEAARRQAEAAAELGLPVETAIDLKDGVKLELVLIPPGRFLMGSPPEEAKGVCEDTRHWVMVTRPFYIGKYEVTQEQWEGVMGTNPSNFMGPKHPVENVSWDDCQEFLAKMSSLGAGPGVFRLPTEAEWEWACRAGTRTRFCCGDDEADLAACAWFYGNSDAATHPAGTRRPNAWGLCDMHGNVWEWCSDWYGPYEERLNGWGQAYDPQRLATGSYRVLRGGSWYNLPRLCRSSSRGRGTPAVKGGDVGLRLVAVPAGH